MTRTKYPPFTELGMLALALIVIGGIYLASHIPQHVSLGPAIALLIASALVLTVNLALLARVPDFAWPRFFQVAKWALLGYAFTAGTGTVQSHVYASETYVQKYGKPEKAVDLDKHRLIIFGEDARAPVQDVNWLLMLVTLAGSAAPVR